MSFILLFLQPPVLVLPQEITPLLASAAAQSFPKQECNEADLSFASVTLA